MKTTFALGCLLAVASANFSDKIKDISEKVHDGEDKLHDIYDDLADKYNDFKDKLHDGNWKSFNIELDGE